MEASIHQIFIQLTISLDHVLMEAQLVDSNKSLVISQKANSPRGKVRGSGR